MEMMEMMQKIKLMTEFNAPMLHNKDPCSELSESIFDRLSKDPEIQDRVILLNIRLPRFQLEIILPERVVERIGRYGLSVIIPGDVVGNRGIEYGEGVPSIIEIALLKIGENNSVSLEYNKSCGYDDVIRLNGYIKLVEEIIRVANFIASPYFRENGEEKNEPKTKDDKLVAEIIRVADFFSFSLFSENGEEKNEQEKKDEGFVLVEKRNKKKKV